MDLKNILLNENTKGHITTIPLIWHFGKNKDTGQKSDQWLPGATGGGNWGQKKMRTSSSNENIPYLECGGGYTLDMCVKPI